MIGPQEVFFQKFLFFVLKLWLIFFSETIEIRRIDSIVAILMKHSLWFWYGQIHDRVLEYKNKILLNTPRNIIVLYRINFVGSGPAPRRLHCVPPRVVRLVVIVSFRLCFVTRLNRVTFNNGVTLYSLNFLFLYSNKWVSNYEILRV